MTEVAARRFATTDVIPAIGRRARAAALLALLVVGYPAALAAAAVPWSWVAVAVLAAVAGLEWAAAAREPAVPWALRHVGLTPAARGLLRGVVVVLLAARTVPDAVTIGAAVTVVVVAAAVTAATAAAIVLAYLTRPAVHVRGLAVRAGGPPVRSWSRLRPGAASAVLELALALGVAIAADAGQRAVIPFFAVAAAVPVVVAGWLAGQARRRQLLGGRRHVSAAAEASVLELAPEVLVYLGGTVEWAYQLEAWLRPLERVRRRVLLIVRDPATLDALAPTSLPVIAVPSALELMRLALPEARLALYVGNTADNLHLLRRPELSSVFIGHGDSDKAASVNPFTRVYREVWVAGDAACARLRDSRLGIPDEAIVKIGRPQLGDLSRRREPTPRFTVLYAPTWEGFSPEDEDSSLSVVGVALIEALLAEPDVRVMYRPHPRAGQRDPLVRSAHRRIVTLLRKAGATSAPAGEDSFAIDPDRYWAEHPGHRILTRPCPDIHASFAVSDVLISDVSSVLTDFLAADRPYAVIDASGEPEERFRARYPTAAGGFVLDRRLSQLGALLAAGRGGADPTAAARAATAAYVLGPRPADPVEPFLQAVEDAFARAQALAGPSPDRARAGGAGIAGAGAAAAGDPPSGWG